MSTGGNVRRAPRAVLALALVAALIGCHPVTPAKFHDLQVGAAIARVEIAATPDARRIGLSYRKTLGENDGMLFIFPKDQMLRFWMKDTYVPLSIAFINSEGVINEIADMEPQTLDPHAAALPARMALEMPRGWFARNNVGPGARIILSEELKRIDAK